MLNRYKRFIPWFGGMLLVSLMIALRVAWPDSDAYPRLSWSSALLTDEGFYVHNARNLVLFGHERLDGWNNMLIMPLLHLLQIGVFRVWGVGVVQERMISVVCSLLTLVIFYDGMRRAWGRAHAFWGVTFLGLDHINLLYNRIGFMDTPAVLLMVTAWWAFIRAVEQGTIREQRGSLILCGAILGAAYAVRGLVALIWWVPIWAVLTPVRHFLGEKRSTLEPSVWYLCGLVFAVAAYGVLWWAPHRAEIAFVSHYYIGHQLLPHSAIQFADNLHKSMDWERGFFPYLLKHSPIQFIVVLLALFEQINRFWRLKRTNSEPDVQRSVSSLSERYMGAWLGVLCLFCWSVNYAPSRYYVLFYPAMAAVAAVQLERMLQRSRRKELAACAVFVCWAVFNGVWMYDWMAHLSYRQRDTDRWLSSHLPPDSVVLGAVAPGLCLNNHLRAVNVIDHLCNDQHPVETIGDAPGYILIIDENWREPWWARHYPGLLKRDRRLHTFPRLLRDFFYIGLYPANRRGVEAFEEIKARKTAE